jgi:hypothetical protein
MMRFIVASLSRNDRYTGWLRRLNPSVTRVGDVVKRRDLSSSDGSAMDRLPVLPNSKVRALRQGG